MSTEPCVPVTAAKDPDYTLQERPCICGKSLAYPANPGQVPSSSPDAIFGASFVRTVR